MNLNLFLIFTVVVSLLSLFNKVFLVLNKRVGWWFGILTGMVAMVYFYIIGLYILTFSEFGFLLVNVYGLTSHKNFNKNLNKKFSFVLSIISAMLLIFFFKNFLTIIEFLSSISFIWGAFFLVDENKKFFGWLMLIFAHIFTCISAFGKGEVLFSFFQILSGTAAFWGLILSLKEKYKCEHNK